MGVYNATIRNSTLGYMGIKLIGFGQFQLRTQSLGEKIWSAYAQTMEVLGMVILKLKIVFLSHQKLNLQP